MQATIVMLILACNAPLPAQTVPQVVAHKALSGQFGPLAEWQQAGYKALQRDATKRLAWITYYLNGESGCDTRTASGQKVTVGRTAAMLGVKFPSKKHPERTWTYALVSLPRGMTLRRIEDTGSPKNQDRAESRGAQTWIDLYTEDWGLQNVTHIRNIWVTTMVAPAGTTSGAASDTPRRS